jgi:hypothetical protein
MSIIDGVKMQTIDTKEAAKILGIRPRSLCIKAKRGLIPGAFKAGIKWMFELEKLEEFIEALQNRHREMADVDINKKAELCHSVKRKTRRFGSPGFQSAESECKSLRAQLIKQRRNVTKINAGLN